MRARGVGIVVASGLLLFLLLPSAPIAQGRPGPGRTASSGDSRRQIPTFVLSRQERPAPDPVALTEAQVAQPQTTADPEPSPAGTAPSEPLRTPGARTTVVIDAGHGGQDTGARGRRGTEEKALTLSVAQRLKTLLESRLGVRVIMTRSVDRAVSPDERAAIANNAKGDIFLSLHANAAPSPAAAGAEVVYHRLEGAARTPDPIDEPTLRTYGGEGRTIEIVPWELAQARYLEASAMFAAMIEERLRGQAIAMSSHPTRTAPLRLLTSVTMPAALIEMGYLTNPAQETLLASDGHQAALAQALYNAVDRFRTHLQSQGAP